MRFLWLVLMAMLVPVTAAPAVNQMTVGPSNIRSGAIESRHITVDPTKLAALRETLGLTGLVDLTGAQTISGIKTFSNGFKLSDNELVTTRAGLIGPQGPAGANGADGAQGPAGVQGPAGPNAISTSTTTTGFTAGQIVGSDGSNVKVALAGTDYLTPTGSGTGLSGIPTLAGDNTFTGNNATTGGVSVATSVLVGTPATFPRYSTLDHESLVLRDQSDESELHGALRSVALGLGSVLEVVGVNEDDQHITGGLTWSSKPLDPARFEWLFSGPVGPFTAESLAIDNGVFSIASNGTITSLAPSNYFAGSLHVETSDMQLKTSVLADGISFTTPYNYYDSPTTLTLNEDNQVVSSGGFAGSGSGLTDVPDTALSSNVPLLNAANAYTNTVTYQPGAAYDTATLGAELLDATTWTLNTGWAYASGTDWTQGFVHSGAITSVAAAPTNGGTGYTLNDVLTVTTGDGTATVTATGVTDGVVTAVTLTSGGTTGYRGGTGQATSGGTGNGCTINVTAIAGGTATLTHSDNATGGYKQVTVTITGRTAGWITVTYGLTTFPATTTSTAWGFSPSAGPLSIAPTTNFDGAVTVSVKAITPSEATLTIKDSSGTATLEGRSQTASLKNQYLGVSSGRYNTTGAYNTGYGNSSLSCLISGNNNTASGYRSLATLTYGSNNCAYGSCAGNVVTIGSGNNLFGQFSGAVLTTGNDNNGFGTRSLFGCVTGSYNVGVGSYTGYVATGSGNVFLGYSAGRYATGSNEFYVNNKDQVNTNQEKANSLLYGVMGANAAAQTLTVNGKLVTSVGLNIPTGTPTSQTDTGAVGDIKWDASYLYVCTATNHWRRVALDDTAW